MGYVCTWFVRLLLICAVLVLCRANLARGQESSTDVSSQIPNGRHFPALLLDRAEAQHQFERDFRREGKRWTVSLCTTDSDGDGLTNGDELGDPCCIWKAGNTPRRTIGGAGVNATSGIVSDPSDASAIVSYATCRATVAAPAVTFSDISFSSIKVNWAIPAEATTCVCRFKLEMSTGSGYQTLAHLPHGTGSFVKANLRADSEYSFRLTAMNADAQFGASSEGTTRTSPDPLAGGVGEQCQGTPTAWADALGSLARSGNDITIPATANVLLDIPLLTVGTLNIIGCLRFSPALDTQIVAETIIVTGLLEIGTEASPHPRQAIIELTGIETPDSGKGFGNKVLTVRANGVLKLHGTNVGKTWGRLATTLIPGTTSLTLQEDVGWLVGNEIVISSTDYDMNQAEQVTITAINGKEITFTPALSNTHASTQTTFDGRTIEERAEVGLLSHNIIIRGDAASVDTHFGGHTIFFESAGKIEIENVEFTRMGQRGILGRYPCHFHLFEHARGSYVRSSSIHHTLQRGFVLHAVHHLHIAWNVLYNIRGHAYFLEDGNEQGNIIEHNLGLVVHPISNEHQLLFPQNFDLQPTVFWMTNPNNTLRYNAAAGSAAHGIWYQLEPFPTGPSQTPYIRPEQWQFGEFKGNVVHSNGQRGLNMWHDFFPRQNPLADGSHADNPFVPVYIHDLVSYRNRREGYFAYVMGDVRLVNARFAGNGIGFTFNHERAPEAIIEGSLFIGDSSNLGEFKKSMVGVQFPRDARLTIRDVSFAGFRPVSGTSQRYAIDWKNTEKFKAIPGNCIVDSITVEAGSLATYHYLHTGEVPLSSDASTTDDDFQASTASQVESAIYHDGYRSTILNSADGSVVGSASDTLVASNRLMVHPTRCQFYSAFNMFRCDGNTNFAQFSMQTEALTNSVDTVEMRVIDNTVLGNSEYLKGKSTKTGTWEYHVNVLDDATRAYRLNFTGTAGTPEDFTFRLARGSRSGSSVTKLNLVFYNRSPLIVTITDTSTSDPQPVVLSPANATVQGHTYDCLANEVSFALSTSVTISTRDAKKSDIPAGVQCVPFLNGTCPDNCGGSSRGRCQLDQTCACKWGWWGESCHKFHCAHLKWCHGNGECVGPNECQCYPEFQGRDCRDQEQFEFMRRTLAFGDIHVRTFDNVNYTFNGIGEFYFVKSSVMTVQARLTACDASASTSCTQRVAFRGGSDTVEIRSQAAGSHDLSVYINGRLVDITNIRENLKTPPDATYGVPTDAAEFARTVAGQVDPESGVAGAPSAASLLPNPATTSRYVLASGNTIVRQVLEGSGLAEYTISFAPHAELKLWSDRVGFIGVSFSVAASLSGSTSGLYGTFDGDINNEFIPRGQSTNPQPLSAETIHMVFGESWRVPQSESYFTYASDATYTDVNPAISFASIPFNNGVVPEGTPLLKDARESCARIGLTGFFFESCVYDVVATGNINMALGTAAAAASDSCAANPSSCAHTSCPSFCSLHGRCDGGKCKCNFGWRGDGCATRGLTDPYIVLFVLLAVFVVALCLFTVWWCRRTDDAPPAPWQGPDPDQKKKKNKEVNPLHVMGQREFVQKVAEVTYLRPDTYSSSDEGAGGRRQPRGDYGSSSYDDSMYSSSY